MHLQIYKLKTWVFVLKMWNKLQETSASALQPPKQSLQFVAAFPLLSPAIQIGTGVSWLDFQDSTKLCSREKSHASRYIMSSSGIGTVDFGIGSFAILRDISVPGDFEGLSFRCSLEFEPACRYIPFQAKQYCHQLLH